MSTNNNVFTSIRVRKPKTNSFDLTHDVKMSGQMGELIPILTIDCVPGDSFNISNDFFLRYAPLQAPIMHRVDVSVHTFFVPYRILWPESSPGIGGFESFITDPSISVGSVPTVPITAALTPDQKKFLDYMGIPPNMGGTTIEVNALALAAYQCIYNEYYRDQNMISEVNYQFPSAGGTQPIGIFATMRKRAWEHDYFTSALPTAQAGSGVDLPLGTIELDPDYLTSGNVPHFEDLTGTNANGPLSGSIVSNDIYTPTEVNLAYNPDGTLIVSATTINDFRRAEKIQQWLEKIIRGGNRYIERIWSSFGVMSKDARLNRPEYIGGSKSAVIISEVLNTSATQTAPQGDMSGHGISIGNGTNGNYNCTEHGVIISIMSIMPKTAYQQGIPKMYLKNDPLDYFWPDFAHLGEQEITQSELYAYTATPDTLFGYIPRYSEYKYMPSRVAGDFRTTLDYWHLGRIFGSAPALNEAFIECDNFGQDLNRIFAVTTDIDNLYIHVVNKVLARRPMPVFGTPQL